MKKKSSSGHGTGKKSISFVKALVAGSGIGITVWVILVFVLAYAISGHSEPELFITPGVFVLAAVSSAVSGAAAVKLSGVNSLLPGLLSGAVMLVCVFILSLICSDKQAVPSAALRILLCVDFAAFSLLGARLAMKDGRKRVRHGK